MSDNQKEIGAILIEMSNRNVDRFFSLIEFAVVVFTLYASIAIYNLDKIIESLQIIDYKFLFCILSGIIAIYYSISQIQDSWKSITIFKRNGGLIQFKSEQELSELNNHLFSSITTQSDTFISSLLLIVCSLGFCFSYLLPEEYPVKNILFYAFFVLFIISIVCKYREELMTWYRKRENNITN